MSKIEEIISREFPQKEDLVYLNHAGVAPWPVRTVRAVKEFAEENVLTGAMNYPAWVKKETELRQQLQQLLNAPSSDDIALLKNTSEALSVVACGIQWASGENVVSTDQEFPSNRIVWQAQQRHGVEFREVDIMNTGDPEQALMDACDKNTRVLAVSSVQFGTGFRLKLEVLGEYCRQHKILFCVDAIQSIGAHNIDVQNIQADFVMADGHKWMLGPEGIAVFYCNGLVRDQLQLNQFGWHMVEDCGNYDRKDWEIARSARRFECGSSNMLGIHALSASLSLIEEVGIDVIEDKIRERIDYLMENLSSSPRTSFLTPGDPSRRAGILTFTIKGMDMAGLYRKLMEQNIICARRMGGIRFSPHFYTAREKINKALEVINLSV
jgi:selenocysteine lyase/cysteine desulfurase